MGIPSYCNLKGCIYFELLFCAVRTVYVDVLIIAQTL